MLYVIGDGGHARVIKEAARLSGWPTCAIKEDSGFQETDSVAEEMFLKRAAALLGQDDGLICGIGSVGSMQLRQQVISKYTTWAQAFQNVIHPSSVLSGDVKLGRGVFIAQGCQVVSGVVIGDHAVINTASVLDHDSHIGEGSHVAPGSILCGSVQCGRWVHIGPGTVIIQGLRIADGVILGAGSVVTHDITEPHTTWVGAPVRRIH